MRHTTYLISLMLLIFMVAGCGNKISSNSNDSRVIADFKNGKITVADFKERLAQIPEGYKKIVNTRKKEFLEDMILENLLYNEALKQGIDKEQEVIKLLDESKKKIFVSRLIEKITASILVAEEDKKKFYEDNKGKFNVPPKIRVSHILVNSREEANSVLQRINDGESFEDMARKYSNDPTKDRGGDIGYVSQGDLIPDFEKAAYDLEIGDVSDVVQTTLGFHIIKVTERQAEHTLEYDEVQENINAELLAQKKKDYILHYADQIKDSVKVEIDEELLDQIPVGAAAVIADKS